MERQEGHISEPWRVSDIDFEIIANEAADDTYDVVADCGTGGDREESYANAARIVACVNALAGISTAALEQLASLPAKERFGALSDIAKLHEMKEE